MTAPARCATCSTYIDNRISDKLCAWCRSRLPPLPLQAIVDSYTAGNTHPATEAALGLKPGISSNTVSRLRAAGLDIQRGATPPTVPHGILGPTGRDRRPAFTVARRPAAPPQVTRGTVSVSDTENEIPDMHSTPLGVRKNNPNLLKKEPRDVDTGPVTT